MSFRMLKPFMACSAFFLLSQFAVAQSKVAVINMQKALFETAEIKKADADMQATLTPRKTQAERLNAEITQIANKLQVDAAKLTPQAELQLQTDGKKKQLELTRINEDLEADATSMRNDILSKSSDRMAAVVKKMAEEKGIDLVVDTQMALYFKPTMDITADATAAYDKTYPAAAAPAKK